MVTDDKWIVMGDDCSCIAVSTYLVSLEHAADVIVVGGGEHVVGHVGQHEGDVVIAPDHDGHLGIQTAYTLNDRVHEAIASSSSSLSWI